MLPQQKPFKGRPNLDHRQIVNGILWILRTGAPWRDLPPSYGVHSTVSSRFYRWRKAGIWDNILARLQTIADYEERIVGRVHSGDSTVIRAHQHEDTLYEEDTLCEVKCAPTEVRVRSLP